MQNEEPLVDWPKKSRGVGSGGGVGGEWKGEEDAGEEEVDEGAGVQAEGLRGGEGRPPGRVETHLAADPAVDLRGYDDRGPGGGKAGEDPPINRKRGLFLNPGRCEHKILGIQRIAAQLR